MVSTPTPASRTPKLTAGSMRHAAREPSLAQASQQAVVLEADPADNAVPGQSRQRDDRVRKTIQMPLGLVVGGPIERGTQFCSRVHAVVCTMPQAWHCAIRTGNVASGSVGDARKRLQIG